MPCAKAGGRTSATSARTDSTPWPARSKAPAANAGVHGATRTFPPIWSAGTAAGVRQARCPARTPPAAELAAVAVIEKFDYPRLPQKPTAPPKDCSVRTARARSAHCAATDAQFIHHAIPPSAPRAHSPAYLPTSFRPASPLHRTATARKSSPCIAAHACVQSPS